MIFVLAKKQARANTTKTPWPTLRFWGCLEKKLLLTSSTLPVNQPQLPWKNGTLWCFPGPPLFSPGNFWDKEGWLVTFNHFEPGVQENIFKNHWNQPQVLNKLSGADSVWTWKRICIQSWRLGEISPDGRLLVTLPRSGQLILQMYWAWRYLLPWGRPWGLPIHPWHSPVSSRLLNSIQNFGSEALLQKLSFEALGRATFFGTAACATFRRPTLRLQAIGTRDVVTEWALGVISWAQRSLNQRANVHHVLFLESQFPPRAWEAALPRTLSGTSNIKANRPRPNSAWQRRLGPWKRTQAATSEPRLLLTQVEGGQELD